MCERHFELISLIEGGDRLGEDLVKILNEAADSGNGVVYISITHSSGRMTTVSTEPLDACPDPNEFLNSGRQPLIVCRRRGDGNVGEFFGVIIPPMKEADR